MADDVPHLWHILPRIYEYRMWARSEQLGTCFKRHTLRRPLQTHAACTPLSSRRRLADGFEAVKHCCSDVRKQVVQFQINGPAHINHESIMQIAEFESGK